MAAPYLLKRRAGWYLRLRIPAELAPLLGSHLNRRLKTRDYGEARRRAVARLHSCWQEAEGVLYSHRLPSDGPLTADDYIRFGRQRLQPRLVAGAVDLRARLIDDIEAAMAGAVTPCKAVLAPPDNRTAALRSAPPGAPGGAARRNGGIEIRIGAAGRRGVLAPNHRGAARKHSAVAVAD